MKVQNPRNMALRKVLTGIEGFDEITNGGLPYGRPTLIAGEAGCGKTLFSMEFLVNGAIRYDEPGVFISFEESENELITNMASLGLNLQDLIRKKKLYLDFIHIERSEIEETGEYDLEALFIRLDQAIKTVNAKRMVLDTIESLFSGLPNPAILRAELRRLFRWLKEKEVTVIITGERGDGGYTRQGMEEYVSDCVIMLDHRIIEQVSTRRLRVVKYRGSSHGTNEYPFLISEEGISVVPITSLALDHTVSEERISSGMPEFDKLFDGKGFYRGSTVMISGPAGTGKSSLVAQIANERCRQGERVLYFTFEESPNQIMRNMRSIGIHLEPWIKKGLLKIRATRPTFYGLEMHLASILKEIKDFKPHAVIIDPLNSFVTSSNEMETKFLSIKLIDFLKSRQITGLFTALSNPYNLEQTTIYISSVIDTWIILRDIEAGGEKIHGIDIMKSRGMPHSNKIRHFRITSHGIQFDNNNISKPNVSHVKEKVKEPSKEIIKANNKNKLQRL